jgi:uncharacterized protein involved in exopolysaccharide biosynthesis
VNAQAADVADDDLLHLWRTLWTSRWVIVLVTSTFMLGGLAYALMATPLYQASVVLAPPEQSGGSSSPLGQLGGLASIAGVQLAGDRQQRSIAVLRSASFTREFIRDQKLLPVLLEEAAAEGVPLDMRDAVRRFDSDVRFVSDDKRTGLVTVTVEWKDPEVAARWANALVARLNEQLRARALQDHGRNVAYLRDQMAATRLVSLQQSLGNLLESEMQQLLLARGNREFAFRVIDAAEPPKYRSYPQRAMLLLGATVVGGSISVFFVLIRARLRGVPAAAG